MNQSPWEKFHDHLVENCSNALFTDDTIQVAKIDSSVDIFEGDLYEYMISIVPEFEELDLDNEIFGWQSITELERFMPTEAAYSAEVLLSYTTTGFTGTTITFHLIRFYEDIFIISGDGEWVFHFLHVKTQIHSPNLTNLLFYLFTFEKNSGRVLPLIDLRPMELNADYINHRTFDQLLSEFQSGILINKNYKMFNYREFVQELSDYDESHIETFLTTQLNNHFKKIKSGVVTNDDLPGLNEIYRLIIMGWKN